MLFQIKRRNQKRRKSIKINLTHVKGDIQGKIHVIDIRSVGVHHETMMMNAIQEGAHHGMNRTIDMILETDVEIHVIADMMIEDMMIEDMTIVDMMIVLQTIEEIHLVIEEAKNRATEEILIPEVEILAIGFLTIGTLAITIRELDLTRVVDHREIGNENFQTLTIKVEIIIR